jgi:hypothetical protein
MLQGRRFERAGFHDHVWGDTLSKWTNEGYPTKDDRPVDPGDNFGFDIVMFGGIDAMPIRGYDEVIEETEAWIVRRNGAGAVLKSWKDRSGAPEHIAFDLTSRKIWETEYRHHLIEYIGRMRESFARRGLPTISVDTKKKDLIGNFKN